MGILFARRTSWHLDGRLYIFQSVSASRVRTYSYSYLHFILPTTFCRDPDTHSSNLIGHGYHMNKNTIERFRDCNKNELLSKYGEDLYARMKTGACVDDPSKLVSFVLLTFAVCQKS